MIYCVRVAEVLKDLHGRGFARVDETESHWLFASGAMVLTIRKPNVNGKIPETLVNIAYDAAGVPPPSWTVEWCD